MQGNFPGIMHASFIDVMLPSDVPIKVELIHDNYMRLWDDFVGEKVFMTWHHQNDYIATNWKSLC